MCRVLIFRVDPAGSPPPSVASFRRAAFTTHHSSISHTSLITAQLITAPLLRPHLSHLHFSQLHFIILSQHNSSQLRGQQTAFRVVAAGVAAAAGPRLLFAWQAQHTELPGATAAPRPSGAAAFRSFAWQAQHTEPPGATAARLAAAGPRLPFILDELPRAWPRLPLVWQAQYTELPGGAAARVAAAGPWLPFAWQAQHTEPPGAIFTADGSDLACRSFSIDLVFLFSTVI